MAVTRISPCDWGGVEVWDSADGLPVYFRPDLVATCFAAGQLTVEGQARVDQVIADRLATREIEANMQEVIE